MVENVSISGIPRYELQRIIKHHILTWLYLFGQFADNPKNFRSETKIKMPNEQEFGRTIQKQNKFMAF